jgi:hypothetical protein
MSLGSLDIRQMPFARRNVRVLIYEARGIVDFVTYYKIQVLLRRVLLDFSVGKFLRHLVAGLCIERLERIAKDEKA